MSEKLHAEDGADDKHEAGRRLAEAAMVADRAGDPDRADDLLEQAAKVDAGAAAEVLAESDGGPQPDGNPDEELAAMSETVVPGSDAPSRAGITGTGSGADGQGL